MSEFIEKGVETHESEQETINIINNTGLGEYIRKISKELGNLDPTKVNEIPIPLDLIPTGSTKFTFDKKVSEVIDVLKNISNDTSNLVEVPFCLTGKRKSLQKINIVGFRNLGTENGLKPREAHFDGEKLGKVLTNIKNNENLDTLIIGHNHPLVPKSEQHHVLTSKLSKETKEKYKIKEIGLNSSLPDLHGLVYLRNHESVPKNIEIYSCVVKHDGNTTFLGIENDKFVKYEN